jgi:hypothetical protein
MKLNLDRSVFSVIASLNGEAYTVERDMSEMTFSKIVEDIQNGQLEDVIAVIEFNPAEGWSNDVTADVMAAAFPEEDAAEHDNPADYDDERIGEFEAGVGRFAA